jgi:hypothetical protein
VATRGWAGLWDSSFGRLRLIEEGRTVRGFYECGGPSTLEGESAADRFEFRYREPGVEGEGRFGLAKDGESFDGFWRARGEADWSKWNGARAQAQPGVTWLVVLEAHWQRTLAETEYAFGHMLREYFARSAGVRVRQRFFHDAESLERWCRDLLLLAEPIVLVIASHGAATGLSVHGEVIDSQRILAALQHANGLRLLHFSSCLVGLSAQAMNPRHFAVSGYTTSVDWGASALLEFTYLDLILNRGMGPAEAAAKLPSVVPYAGDQAPPGSPYPPAGFRFLPAP